MSLPPIPLIEEITNGIKIPRVLLQLENDEGRKREYEFGVDAIQESLAQMIEGKIYGGFVSNEFPYIAGKQLAEFVCPRIAADSEFLFAALDISLMSPYPGWHFYLILLEIENTGFQPKRQKTYMVLLLIFRSIRMACF
ncbi:hypothetical protein [Paraflavitalea speifideaquila]|uniref:hypothetical protein n=1 Tax=Paraflavitalea speifideaquila TaxID=3076558 RepID=UPI0028E4F88E|nr:hypothetical protein [Paraflavitalea speifideiaquila]